MVQEENTRTHSSFVTNKAKEELNLIAGGTEGFVPISFARHDLRLCRIEMPVFDGENPDG